MSIKKIKEHNTQQFLDDLKRATEVLVITPQSNAYLSVKKTELKLEAAQGEIFYYMTNKIYKVRRTVMVVT